MIHAIKKVLDGAAESTVRYWKLNLILNLVFWNSDALVSDLLSILAIMPFPVRRVVYLFLLSL